MVPGKPTSTHGMTQKLGRHGIPVRTARNAALAALAADLPSPILADVTGMHRHTALRWVAYARCDRAEYLAARAADNEEAPPLSPGRGITRRTWLAARPRPCPYPARTPWWMRCHRDGR